MQKNSGQYYLKNNTRRLTLFFIFFLELDARKNASKKVYHRELGFPLAIVTQRMRELNARARYIFTLIIDTMYIDKG